MLNNAMFAADFGSEILSSDGRPTSAFVTLLELDKSNLEKNPKGVQRSP